MMRNILFKLALYFTAILFVSCQNNSFRMSSVSMEPNISKDQIITIDFSAYENTAPKLWDIVSFFSPKMEDTEWCMRVVGLPGDVIDFDSSGVKINGQRLNPPNGIEYKFDSEFTSGLLEIDYPYTVPENKFYLLGDNVNEAYDSRFWGAISKDRITGKVIAD